MSLAVLLSLAALKSCGATTITEQPGAYRYGAGEPIEVIDIETREALGTLTVTGAEILVDKPFETRRSAGTDEDGDTIYETVTYEQIVQVFYTFTGSRRLSESNFTLRDSFGELTTRPSALEPRPAYTPITKRGQSSFVVALQKQSGYLDINFTYNVLQIRPTARIRLEF
jgi:hypothetical protein